MCDFPHFVERGKQPTLQYFSSVGSVEALDEGIPVRLARLDETQFGALVLAPVGHIL